MSFPIKILEGKMEGERIYMIHNICLIVLKVSIVLQENV